MCLTYCHRRRLLYWNHEDCNWHCSLAVGPHASCDTCRHRRGAVCRLTSAQLPQAGGCCHHNEVLYRGWQLVTPGMLEPLGVGQGETPADVLSRWDAPFRQLDGQGQVVVVDPDGLGVPVVYGMGTARDIEEEPFPWPEEVG